MINYCPTPGAKIEITVTDNAGNTVSRLFGTGDPTQIANATVTYNPWDPSEFSTQMISIDFTGDAWLKIYDFGGDLVKALHTTNGTFSWNGMTEDGTRVADGVYIGHITVDTDAGTYSTVVKLAIVEK
jgi:flagellar hook assembly protein FlgD